MIGGVGQRMLTGVTKKMAGEFFKAVDADIASRTSRRSTSEVGDAIAASLA